MDLAERRKLYNRCRPSEARSPGDPRYVAIDELGELVRSAPRGAPDPGVVEAIRARQLARQERDKVT